MKFGKLEYNTPLAQLIRSKGFNQTTLAEKSGLSVTAVNWLSIGKTRFPRLDTILLLAKALDVEYTEVIERIL